MRRIHIGEYEHLKKISPMMNWDDIKEGETYHIPPIMLYDRRDIFVQQKDEKMLHVIMTEGNEKPRPYSLFKTEVSSIFIVKKQK